MSCLCRYLSTVPAPGDGEVVILSKILQVLNDGGGSGLGGVTSISVDGGPAQTGAVSITTAGASALFNFTDENTANDGVMWANQRTTEVLRSVGATGFLQTTAGRIHRDVDNNVLAFLGGTSKGTSSFFEMAGQAAASPGFAVVTTKGQTLGAGTFRIINAPNSSTVGTVRAEMVWEGNWALTPIWNDVANAFVAFDVNPTNTLSAAGALLGRFRASGVSQWEVSKAGATTQLGSGTMTQLRLPNTSSATVGGIYFNAVRSMHNFGTNNFFAGPLAGNLTMTGANNTGIGNAALIANTTGAGNTGIGVNAMLFNTTGASNTGIGSNAMALNTTGANNTAIGFQALYTNDTGASNTGIGNNALFSNTTGASNAGVGVSALFSNTTGANNTGIGASALVLNTLGANNTGIGYNALLLNTLGANNTGIGASALLSNTTGANNTAIGFQAGDNLTTGSNNLVIGYDIDSPTAVNSNTLTVGNLIFGTALDGIGTAVSSGNIAVGIVTPFQKFSVLGAIGAYELATDSSNYSRTSITPQTGNHLIRTEAAGTGTLRILQVGSGPATGANIAGVNSIAHGGQSTGSAAGGSYLIQVSPAGGAGSGVNALATVLTQSTTDLIQATAIRFAVASGANQRAGNATLVGGTVTVSNTTVTGNTIVMLTRKTSGGTIGTAITYTVSASTSFTINSDNILDTSSFSYFLIEVP